MKKLLITLSVILIVSFTPGHTAQAQIPIVDIIKEAVKKAIKAIDLQIQKQQNKVIWLQNAQKKLENTMSKTKLGEINSWVKQQKELYQDYYEELKKVKAALAYYKRLRDIAQMQSQTITEYRRAWALFREDKHFSQEELKYMGRFYTGIMEESSKHIDELYMVVNSFQTQMSDAKRLELINTAADKIEETYNDLRSFNQQGIRLSLQRSREQNDVAVTRKLYGIK